MDGHVQITCLNYGPFDNGHILVGFEDGKLIAFDYLTLDRLESVKAFKGSAITSIAFDPTNYIFVGAENGKMISLSYIDKKTHYVYLDMGKSKYCTVQLPKTYTPDFNGNTRVGYDNIEEGGRSSNFCGV
jgi:WD40 repeat protein